MRSYEEVKSFLRDANSGTASDRDSMVKQPWKVEERQAFLDRVQSEGAKRLLEVGAGTGQDSVFFKENGLEVVATDLTPEMVERCREKGLEAHVRDFIDLGFPHASFDAVHAMNCLLHVPNSDLPDALQSIRDVLRPSGLCFIGTYGIDGEHEGIWDTDKHEPKRFFSFRSDERMRAFAEETFEVVDFHTRELDTGFRTQALTLRRPA